MTPFSELPAGWQAVVVFLAVFGIALIGLWLYARRGKRRELVSEAVPMLRDYGFVRGADVGQAYANGRYKAFLSLSYALLSDLVNPEKAILIFWASFKVMLAKFLQDPVRREAILKVVDEARLSAEAAQAAKK